MARVISSPLTILIKFCGGVAIAFWGLLTVLAITRAEDRWTFVRGWIFMAFCNALVLPLSLPLKRIEIDGDQLVVSRFFKKIRIDPSNISDVTQIASTKLNMVLIGHVWIHFKKPTAFGKKIMFMPDLCLSAIGSPHPIVKELKELGGLTESKHEGADE